MKRKSTTTHGRIVADGDVPNWNRFLLVPDDGRAPIKFGVSPGARAFMLHGIIHLQPQVRASIEILEGHPSLFISIDPEFAWEWEWPGIPFKIADVVASVTRNDFKRHPNRTTEAGPARRCGAEIGPEAVQNHHPRYTFVGYLPGCAGYK